ncbi:helix-turn-helix domain-containing protein [Saccharopolyspora rosea]|uniref:helix-turn-helix domain-containing protein n=1 Tax=Saccharopolyspora rosea TaxID=524884 RepID=UPI0021D8C903|nr:helix-turn-helix domain-containing protein [Saccharopolyspora rosea]
MPTDTNTTGLDGPRTETETRIWDALSSQPQTTAQVVSAAGVGRSTAGKALARWAKAGLINRQDGDEENPAATWSRMPEQLVSNPAPETNTAIPDALAQPEPVGNGMPKDPEPDEDGADTEAPMHAIVASAKPERLKPGGLYRLVKDYLREHPGEEFGPSQIGKALNRSSGAVNNALEKMVTQGAAVKTQDAPKRFALASGEVN